MPYAIQRLLSPRSIAIVGASPTPGALGASVLANLERANYAGAIHLINPKRKEINGRPCVASPADLPAGVDCAVLAIPRAGVIEALRECGKAGVGSAIIFSAGFAEDGEAGKAAQAEIAAIASEYHMIVEGPNCLGLANYVDNIPLSFIDLPGERLAKKQGIAIVSQSGAMAAVISVVLGNRGLGLTHYISTGNEAVAGVEDFVEHLLESPATKTIVMIVEQFRQPQRFLKLCARARELNIPILLLHPGKSAAARQSAATHTGALAGDYAVMRMKLEHAGVAIVETLEELGDLAELVYRCPAAPQGGTAVLTESGAFKALTLDFAESIGLDLLTLSPETTAALRAALPEFIPPSSPLDLTAQALVDPDLYRRTMVPLLADPAAGALVLGLVMTNHATSRLKLVPVAAAIRELLPQKPIIVAGLDHGAEVEPALIDALRDLGVPFFASPERAFRALKAFTLLAKPARPTRALPEPASEKLPAGVIAEYRSKQILAPLGIALPPGGFATDLATAKQVAARIGYPIVLKAQADALPHKSDAGGVILNLHNEAELESGWTKLHTAVAAVRPELTLDGVLVEKMGARGFELIVGARNDADWGPVLLIGAGGVLAEAIQDVRLLPPDLTPEAIAAELLQLKSAAILKGFRGSPALDAKAAAEAVAKLGAFVSKHPEITEIDINPLVIYPEGALALDALIYTK